MTNDVRQVVCVGCGEAIAELASHITRFKEDGSMLHFCQWYCVGLHDGRDKALTAQPSEVERLRDQVGTLEGLVALLRERAEKADPLREQLIDAGRKLEKDVVCEHGTAMDVHCCNCHSGFLFDSSTCVCEAVGDVLRGDA